MLDHSARIKAWLADLEEIQIAVDAPAPPRVLQSAKRRRKPRPFWEE